MTFIKGAIYKRANDCSRIRWRCSNVGPTSARLELVVGNNGEVKSRDMGWHNLSYLGTLLEMCYTTDAPHLVMVSSLDYLEDETLSTEDVTIITKFMESYA
jgi:hypothetical protein